MFARKWLSFSFCLMVANMGYQVCFFYLEIQLVVPLHMLLDMWAWQELTNPTFKVFDSGIVALTGGRGFDSIVVTIEKNDGYVRVGPLWIHSYSAPLHYQNGTWIKILKSAENCNSSHSKLVCSIQVSSFVECLEQRNVFLMYF